MCRKCGLGPIPLANPQKVSNASKTMQLPKQHVIFLGAGASYTSGYPVGDSLRLRLSGRNHFKKQFWEGFGIDTLHSLKEKDRWGTLFNDFKGVIDLLRNGGFGTVDEFSKLMSNEHPDQIKAMKKLMRLALAFSNPEDEFHKSDYYPFVQRLFRDDQLSSLKNYVTVISYNYDCYLDFLLSRAYTTRQAGHEPTGDGNAMLNRLASGFYDEDHHPCDYKIADFRYFKLHGSIAYARSRWFGHQQLFLDDNMTRLGAFSGDAYKNKTPPILFPWELFDEKNEFIEADEFVFVKHHDEGSRGRGEALFKMYKTLWQNAQLAVRKAQKISFVGLSMHPYLEDGLKYLFQHKSGKVEVVVANPQNRAFKDSQNHLHPASLCGKMNEVLRRAAPKMQPIKSSAEDDGMVNMDVEAAMQKDSEPDITPRYSFREFITTEMD